MKYKSVFISDLHIGSSHCQLDKILAFFKNSEFDNLFLVGDIVDCWLLEKRFKWPKEANLFFQKILRFSRKGVNIIYLVGNHDNPLLEFVGSDFGGIKVERESIYHSLSGRKFLVLHGDQFDGLVAFCPRLQRIGAYFYEASMFVNWIFRAVGIRWSFSSFLKQKAKNAVKFISAYKNSVVSYCLDKEVDGCILGHIHSPELTSYDGCLYYNIGDLVESGTILVEHLDGKFEIIKL